MIYIYIYICSLFFYRPIVFKKANRNEFNDDWFLFHFTLLTSTLKLTGSLNNMLEIGDGWNPGWKSG